MTNINIDRVIFQAPLHKSWVSLAREFNISPEMLRYNLCRVHKLMLVKAILKQRKVK